VNVRDFENLSDPLEGEPADRADADGLLRELGDALRPEPLPERLRRTIDARLDTQTVVVRRTIPFPLRLAALPAAAAALVFAVVTSQTLPVATAPTAASVLTPADAKDIAAACALLGWSGATDYSLERISSELNNLGKQIERDEQAQAGLPWSAEEDWDTPVKGRGASAPQIPGRHSIG
jgi:hypothetical protein